MNNKYKYVRIAIKILGVLAFINLLTMPFTARIALAAILQALLLISICLYALFFDKLSKLVHIVVIVGFSVPLIFAVFLGVYGNRSTATFDEDVVIVLGAGIIGEELSQHLAKRLNRAIYYFERNPNVYIIVCGGLGDRATITEAEAMARHLYERGVPRERILLEKLSTSTLENLIFAQEILNEYFPEGFNAVLISSDFHMFRAVRMARSIGMDVNHLGAPTPVFLLAENYLREMLAVTYFLVFG
ncbi:MAG: YdcF family protein [Defluviitaleaceae bacterium]|nr:YdcF family protein [Defluviitaleaceae bacterium]